MTSHTDFQNVDGSDVNPELENLRGRLFAFLETSGACAVGVCTREGLVGGPPSSDLTRELASAQSAVVFAMPQDDDKIEAYMGKIDHGSYQKHYIDLNTQTIGLAAEVAHVLRGQGFEAVPVHAGNTASGGDTRDVTPQNDEQREAAEKYPADPSEYAIGSVPVVSQRYLAAASGVGFFGMSGNILTASHGATVVLGATITSARLPATPPLPPEANYCDECNWCGSVCPTTFMSRTERTEIELGDRTHKYSKRLHHMRCGMHMGGQAGLSEDGKFGSWGPGRKQMPKNDEELFPAVLEMIGDTHKRPEVPGGFILPTSPDRVNIMCSACNLVCHPEREVRAKRVKMWRQGGVVVQHEDGHLEAMPAEDAKEFVTALPAERRALYEESDE